MRNDDEALFPNNYHFIDNAKVYLDRTPYNTHYRGVANCIIF